jgi:hypothetical protein
MVRILTRKHRRGVTLVYVLVSFAALSGLCSLAVDLGHAEVVKMELTRACDATAHDYVQLYSTGGQTYANTYGPQTYSAAENPVDDGMGVKPTVVVTWGYWNTTSNSFSTTASSYPVAVRVTMSRTAANGNPVPLVLCSLLGCTGIDISVSSTAALITQSSTQYVSTNSNPWLAGEPLGTLGSQPDPAWNGQGVNPEHPWQYDVAGPNGGTASWGEPYTSPVQISFAVTPGSTITLSNVTGQGNNDLTQSAEYTATGNDNGFSANYDDYASGGISEHGMADVTMPLNSLNAVFLSNSLPDSQTPPPPLDFSTQAERDYTAGSNNGQATGATFAPQLQQVFYIGNGFTSTGTQETIVVPDGTTRMFLGTMDGWEWSNNSGGFTATLTQQTVEFVQ